MLRSTLLFLVLFPGNKILAQLKSPKQTLTKTDSILIKQENPYQSKFGRFFKTSTLYAILLDTSKDNKQNITYIRLKLYENVGNEWYKKNEFDSLQISIPIQSRFCNYSNDAIKDYLFSAGIVGTGGNETEYLFLFDNKSKTMKLIKGFESLPSTSYDVKTGIITSIGLAASIPNFGFYKIQNF